MLCDHRRDFELGAAGEEGVGEGAVAGEQGGVAGGDLVETLEREAGQALVGMGLGDAEQFVQPPHPLGERRARRGSSRSAGRDRP